MVGSSEQGEKEKIALYHGCCMQLHWNEEKYYLHIFTSYRIPRVISDHPYYVCALHFDPAADCQIPQSVTDKKT